LINLFTFAFCRKVVGEEVENKIGLIVMYTGGVFEGKRAGVGDRRGGESGVSTTTVDMEENGCRDGGGRVS
jgi:hypothetical protein